MGLPTIRVTLEILYYKNPVFAAIHEGIADGLRLSEAVRQFSAAYYCLIIKVNKNYNLFIKHGEEPTTSLWNLWRRKDHRLDKS